MTTLDTKTGDGSDSVVRFIDVEVFENRDATTSAVVTTNATDCNGHIAGFSTVTVVVLSGRVTV